jgi:hypothetical protein
MSAPPATAASSAATLFTPQILVSIAMASEMSLIPPARPAKLDGRTMKAGWPSRLALKSRR